MRELLKNEYIKDGEIYCAICNTPKTFTWEGQQIEGNCQCVINARMEEARLAEIARKKSRILELKEMSDLGNKYIDCYFSNSFRTPERAAAQEYCKNSRDNYTNGNGLYMYGKTGTGKTQTMACILNELAEKLYLCYFTNFNNIQRDMREAQSFNSRRTEADVFDFYARKIDFLFIDDLGTEYISEKDGRMQALMYDVINKRINNNKPIIFSSNYSLSELVSYGLDPRTIWRIKSTCKEIEFTGENLRKKNLSNCKILNA